MKPNNSVHLGRTNMVFESQNNLHIICYRNKYVGGYIVKKSTVSKKQRDKKNVAVIIELA